MNPKLAIPSLALAAIVLSGCTTTSAPAPTPTPTIDPGPVKLTAEEAGERYLQIVCPGNVAGDALNAAFAAGEAEFFNGGAPDPTAVKAAGAAALDINQAEARFLDDEYFIWPEEVAEQVAALRDHTITNLAYYSAVANAVTFEDAYYATYIGGDEGATAAQAIRFELGLDPDTTASCVGYEDGHSALAEEKTERDAELAKFD